MGSFYDYYDEFSELSSNQNVIINQNDEILKNQYTIISGDVGFYNDFKEYHKDIVNGLSIICVGVVVSFLILVGNLVTCFVDRGGIFHA